MIAIFTLLTLVFFSFIILKIGKNSILSINIRSWSLLFYKEIFFVIPSIFFVSIYGTEKLRTFILAREEMNDITSLAVVLTVVSFILFIVFANTLGLGKNNSGVDFSSFNEEESRSIITFGMSSLIAGVGVLVLSLFLLGYKHAFFMSIFTGENLIRIRLDNTYNSSLPTPVSYLISISTFVNAILFIYLLKLKKNFLAVTALLAALFMATSDGSKGTIINVVIITMVSYLVINKPHFNILKALLYITVAIIGGLGLIFYVVSLQIQDLTFDKFLLYLVSRIGVDQMAGTYEAFSVGLHSYEYIWHAIPFASFFVDYPIFSKDLMLLSEGGQYSKTGVKNSLFIAEAFGMGGWSLVLLSPLFFAAGYIFKYMIIEYMTRGLFSESVSRLFSLPLLFLTTKLTGDFSSVVLQKGTVLLVLVFIAIYLVSIVVDKTFKYSE